MVALPITLDGSTEWKVEHIVRCRVLHANIQFLVPFVGFDMSESEWLSEDNLGNAKQLLKEYRLSHGLY